MIPDPAPGNSLDYVYSRGVPYPFMFTLRDSGKFGFFLPAEQIVPTALETLDAIAVILEEAGGQISPSEPQLPL